MSFATTKNKTRILTKTQNKKLHAFIKTIYINSVFREKKTNLGPLQKHKTKSLNFYKRETRLIFLQKKKQKTSIKKRKGKL